MSRPWSEEEFRRIVSKIVEDKRNITLETLLRIKNFKAQSPLIPTKDHEEYDGDFSQILKKVNEILHNLDLENFFKEILSIKGIGVATATTILSAWNPEEYAIIDSVIYDNLQKNSIDNLNEILELEGDEELKSSLTELKSKIEEDPGLLHRGTKEKVKFLVETYKKYIDFLKLFKERKNYNDLRDSELQIWKVFKSKLQR